MKPMSTETDRRIAFLTLALEQANDTVRSKVDELSLVRRVGDAISHHTSIWSLSSELVDAIATTVSCKYALIYAGSDAGQFELQAVSSIFSGSEEFPVVIKGSQIIRHLEETGSPIGLKYRGEASVGTRLAAAEESGILGMRATADPELSARNSLPGR